MGAKTAQKINFTETRNLKLFAQKHENHELINEKQGEETSFLAKKQSRANYGFRNKIPEIAGWFVLICVNVGYDAIKQSEFQQIAQ